MSARGTRVIEGFHVVPNMHEGAVVGTLIKCTSDGREYFTPQFPKRIRNVTEGQHDGEVLVHLTNGQRRTLGERELLEAASVNPEFDAEVDGLVESGKLDEAALETEFLEAGPRGGGNEAEYRAKAMAYPAHAGGIGSKAAEPIGRGKGRKYPPGFQHIRNALIRNGHSVGSASRIAYGALRRWSRGGGKVKPETRAKAAKVLGQLEVGGKASRGASAARALTREATATALREAVRSRKGLEPALASYLSDRGDRRPVNEDVESLREAAQRAISGHGPLRARSRVDQRVLDAQARAVVTHSSDTVMTEATRTRTTVTELEHGLREDEPPPQETDGGVFVALPPEKGTLPTVVVDEDTKRIGEVTAPRELDQTDLGELQEQALALYNRTSAPTHQGRSYLSSAGRVELTQLVGVLREALDSPVAHVADESTPTPAEALGGDTPVVLGRLPNGEAPPADTPHTPEEEAAADASLKRSGYSRDGRSAEGDYVQTFEIPAGTKPEKPLMEGEQLRECKIHVTTPSGKRYSREMGTQTRAKQAASGLRKRGHRVRVEGVRESGPAADAARAAVAATLGDLMEEGGYRGSPHASGRYGPIAGEPHSRSGFHNLSEIGKPRSVSQMTDDKLKYLHKHKRTHPKLRRRVHTELVTRGYRPRLKEAALEEARKTRKRCEVCGQQIPKGAQKCPGCGNTMGTEMDSHDSHLSRRIRQHGVIPANDLPANHPLAIQEADSSSRHVELGRQGIKISRMPGRGRAVYHVRAPGRSLGVVIRRKKAAHAVPRLKAGGFSKRSTQHATVGRAAIALARHHGISILEASSDEVILWERGVSPGNRKKFYSAYGTVRGKFPIPPVGHPQAHAFARAALRRINQSDLTPGEKAKVRARAQKVIAAHRSRGRGRGRLREGDVSPLLEAWSDKARAAALLSRRQHLKRHGGYTARHFDQMATWNDVLTHARAAHHEGDTATVVKAKRYMDRYQANPVHGEHTLPAASHIKQMEKVHTAATRQARNTKLEAESSRRLDTQVKALGGGKARRTGGASWKLTHDGARPVIRGTHDGQRVGGYKTMNGKWMAYRQDEQGWSNAAPSATPEEAVRAMTKRAAAKKKR